MIISYKQYKPSIGKDTFIAENSTIIGRCFIGENCSIWYNTVVRADVNEIIVGRGTNIQDGCVVHCANDYKTIIGENVTIGHNAIIHGCTVGNNCLIGMGSTILDGAVIGDNVIVGANSLITSGKKIPSGVLVMGSPAKVARELVPAEIEEISRSAEGYLILSKEYSRL
ncbi:MAG: gamma carbonic anhydrase family protein [Clostridia bacterium]|jgi:carbonic anhydrase/acetyltransferase-like protein (isoleucine patch superfamily)|nr:gamma carbonic anhydrase family protein [Clostridia bacterium]HOM42814.1 gamma carbonic anhydrase family protein [Bacillota bacterium]